MSHMRGVDQAIELLDDLDMEGDWSNSEDEDGDDSYLSDALEIAQLEADNESSLNDSDLQLAQITIGTEVHCAAKTSTNAEYAAKLASEEEWCTAAWIAIPFFLCTEPCFRLFHTKG